MQKVINGLNNIEKDGYITIIDQKDGYMQHHIAAMDQVRRLSHSWDRSDVCSGTIRFENGIWLSSTCYKATIGSNGINTFVDNTLRWASGPGGVQDVIGRGFG